MACLSITLIGNTRCWHLVPCFWRSGGRGLSDFESLTKALEGWFETPLGRLPTQLRTRVEKDLFLWPWNELTVQQRRMAAEQWDYRHDPATEQERKFWWDLFLRRYAVQERIAEWQAVATPTAIDLKHKDDQLEKLQQELVRIDQEEQKALDKAGSSRGGLDHDLNLQQQANEIAQRKRAETGKWPTRNAVANLLAPIVKMNVDTVLRRIRRQW